MKLDRNITKPRRGKYALILMRHCYLPMGERFNNQGIPITEVPTSAIDYGSKETDFFVIRLKDSYAEPALRAYAKASRHDDPEYAADIEKLAALAKRHPHKRRPD